MRLAIDEHNQHKDVYTHSLTVLDQAIDREDRPAPTSCCGSRRCCTTSASPRPGATRRRAGELPPPRGGRGEADPQAAARAALLRSEVVDEVARLVFLHLRFHGYGTRRVDGLGRAPLRHRRRPAAGAAAQAGALGLHHPQPARAAALPRAYDALEQRIAPCGSRRSWTRSGPTSTATRSCSCSASRPGREVGEAYRHLLALRMEHGPLGRTRRRRSCGGGRRRTASGGRVPPEAIAVGVGARSRESHVQDVCRLNGGFQDTVGPDGAGRRGAARRSWASRPSRYTPAVAATSHGATPVGGASSAATAIART